MSERAWKEREWIRQDPPYVIRVNAHWHNDDTAGLEITCTCGQEMSLCGDPHYGGEDGESIIAEELSHLVAAHAATHAPRDLLRVSPSAVG